MVAHGLQFMQHVVESESGHTQRTVRLVASVQVDWFPPEVVFEQVTP